MNAGQESLMTLIKQCWKNVQMPVHQSQRILNSNEAQIQKRLTGKLGSGKHLKFSII